MPLSKIESAGLGAGTVLQVAVAQNMTNIATTSLSFVTTGLSVTLTPKSSTNKFLIFLNGGGQYATAANSIYTTIYRNSTNIGDATYGLERSWSNSATNVLPHSLATLDAPATASAVTYTAYFRSASGSTVDFNNADRGMVTLTVMEIAA